MFSTYKRFSICRRYEKDIWGYIISKHKIINLAWTKVWPDVENVPHLAKWKWLLQDFSKWLGNTSFWALNFSFEIIRWMKKWWPRKMKNWMWFFFLAKILRIFYGNIKRKTFKNFCNQCMSKKSYALFFFLKIFEFWLPMFVYWLGFAPTLTTAIWWVTDGYVYINNIVQTNKWKLLKLYDFVTFSPQIWKLMKTNISKIFFYGSFAAKRRRCISTKIWNLNKISWAHFISIPEYIHVNLKSFNFYWWKAALPSNIWYYFSVDIANIIKYITI